MPTPYYFWHLHRNCTYFYRTREAEAVLQGLVDKAVVEPYEGPNVLVAGTKFPVVELLNLTRCEIKDVASTLQVPFEVLMQHRKKWIYKYVVVCFLVVVASRADKMLIIMLQVSFSQEAL